MAVSDNNKSNQPLAAQVGLKHLGIIMDGNGRWAKKRLLPRMAGHSQGAKVFEKCVDWCIELGVEYVTFYAFSTENWSRPADEVSSIMRLFDTYLDQLKRIMEKNIILRFLGNRAPLSESLTRKMYDCEQKTAGNTGMYVNIALNYGGRDEILRAAKRLAHEYKNGLDIDALDEKGFESFLYTEGQPDADLIIRPSGEERLSNFLVWQAAYAELVFMDVLWPDFSKKDLISALQEFGKRNRRFGGV